MPDVIAPAARDQVGQKDVDRFELCGEACVASALGVEVEAVASWLRQHEGGERAVRTGTSAKELIDYCRSRGVGAEIVGGPAVEYVGRAVARGHYALVLVWSDHQGKPVPRNQSAKLHAGGIGHWLLGYGTTGSSVRVMQPWGGRLVSYDLQQGQDQQFGIEIERAQAPARPTAPTPAAPASSPKQQPLPPPKATVSPRFHIVKHGDTLSAIARTEHVTLRRLIAANPQIKNPNLIFPGQRIAIPT